MADSFERQSWLILATVCFGFAAVSLDMNIGGVYGIAGGMAMVGYFWSAYDSMSEEGDGDA